MKPKKLNKLLSVSVCAASLLGASLPAAGNVMANTTVMAAKKKSKKSSHKTASHKATTHRSTATRKSSGSRKAPAHKKATPKKTTRKASHPKPITIKPPKKSKGFVTITSSGKKYKDKYITALPKKTAPKVISGSISTPTTGQVVAQQFAKPKTIKASHNFYAYDENGNPIRDKNGNIVDLAKGQSISAMGYTYINGRPYYAVRNSDFKTAKGSGSNSGDGVIYVKPTNFGVSSAETAQTITITSAKKGKGKAKISNGKKSKKTNVTIGSLAKPDKVKVVFDKDVPKFNGKIHLPDDEYNKIADASVEKPVNNQINIGGDTDFDPDEDIDDTNQNAEEDNVDNVQDQVDQNKDEKDQENGKYHMKDDTPIYVKDDTGNMEQVTPSDDDAEDEVPDEIDNDNDGLSDPAALLRYKAHQLETTLDKDKTAVKTVQDDGTISYYLPDKFNDYAAGTTLTIDTDGNVTQKVQTPKLKAKFPKVSRTDIGYRNGLEFKIVNTSGGNEYNGPESEAASDSVLDIFDLSKSNTKPIIHKENKDGNNFSEDDAIKLIDEYQKKNDVSKEAKQKAEDAKENAVKDTVQDAKKDNANVVTQKGSTATVKPVEKASVKLDKPVTVTKTEKGATTTTDAKKDGTTTTATAPSAIVKAPAVKTQPIYEAKTPKQAQEIAQSTTDNKFSDHEKLSLTQGAVNGYNMLKDKAEAARAHYLREGTQGSKVNYIRAERALKRQMEKMAFDFAQGRIYNVNTIFEKSGFANLRIGKKTDETNAFNDKQKLNLSYGALLKINELEDKLLSDPKDSKAYSKDKESLQKFETKVAFSVAGGKMYALNDIFENAGFGNLLDDKQYVDDNGDLKADDYDLNGKGEAYGVKGTGNELKKGMAIDSATPSIDVGKIYIKVTRNGQDMFIPLSAFKNISFH